MYKGQMGINQATKTEKTVVEKLQEQIDYCGNEIKRLEKRRDRAIKMMADLQSNATVGPLIDNLRDAGVL